MPLSLENLNPLLEQFRGDGQMVSCYVDLSGTPGFSLNWPGPFKSKISAVKELLTDDAPAWQQFERNLRAIGRAVTEPGVQRPGGLAVFAAQQRNFFQAFHLEDRVENDLVVHPGPYLVPLLRALCRQRKYLAVLTDTHRGRLYSATPGGVRLLEELEEEVPSRQRSSGERWGKEQATIARHREDRILHYHKELIASIEKVWAKDAFQGLILLGEHEVVEHVRKRLPPRLAARLIHQGPHAWTDRPGAVAETVCAVLANVQQMEQKRIVEDFEKRLVEHGSVASGPRAVLDALQAGRLAPGGHGYLILGPDPREAVARCTACRNLFLDMPTTCPKCQAPCIDRNLQEEILLLALWHGIVAHCVGGNEALARCAGVAAVLPEKKVGQ